MTNIDMQKISLRSVEVIKRSVQTLKLDLKGLTVLTEAGSGNYVYLPVIAALAGAEKVYAWTADSQYGNGEQIKAQCMNIAEFCGVAGSISISANIQPEKDLAAADIITNSGFIRPLDKKKLSLTKKGVVIPLMYEKWELRPEEIDLDYCRVNGIRVAGTWENHPSIMVFEYVGMLAAKMAFEAGYEIFQNRIAVWSDDEFGRTIAGTFRDLGASLVVLVNSVEELQRHGSYDFIFMCDYDESREIFGPSGFIDQDILKSTAGGIVHLYGNVNAEYLTNMGIPVYPDRNGGVSRMSFTLGHVGPEPIIRLHTAGLKVAQSLYRNEKSDLIQEIC